MVMPVGSPRSLTGLRVIFEPSGRNELCNIGIGRRQEADVIDISVEEHLIDIACRGYLLVDNRSDVETLGHTDVVDILNHSHRLSHPHALGRQTGQDVCLGVGCQGHEAPAYCVCPPPRAPTCRVRHR